MADPTSPQLSLASANSNVVVVSQNGTNAAITVTLPIGAYAGLLNVTSINTSASGTVFFGGQPDYMGVQNGDPATKRALSSGDIGTSNYTIYKAMSDSSVLSLGITMTVVASGTAPSPTPTPSPSPSPSPTPTPTPATPTPAPAPTPTPSVLPTASISLDLAGPGGGSFGPMGVIIQGQSNAVFFYDDEGQYQPVGLMNHMIHQLTGHDWPTFQANAERSDYTPSAATLFSGSNTYSINTYPNNPKWLEPIGYNTSNPSTWPNTYIMDSFKQYCLNKQGTIAANRPWLLIRIHNEYDSQLATAAERNVYEAANREFIKRWRSYMGGRPDSLLPVFQVGCGYDSNTNFDMLVAMRNAWANMAADSTLNFYHGVGSSLDALDRSDSSHWTRDSAKRVAARVAIRISKWLQANGWASKSTPTLPTFGPRFTSFARVTGQLNKLDLKVTHDRGTDLIMPASPLLYLYSVTNSGNAKSVTGIARQDATTVRLTLGSNLDASGPIVFDYGANSSFAGPSAVISDNWHQLDRSALGTVDDLSWATMIMDRLRAPLTDASVSPTPIVTPTPTPTTPPPTPAPTPTPPTPTPTPPTPTPTPPTPTPSPTGPWIGLSHRELLFNPPTNQFGVNDQFDYFTNARDWKETIEHPTEGFKLWRNHTTNAWLRADGFKGAWEPASLAVKRIYRKVGTTDTLVFVLDTSPYAPPVGSSWVAYKVWTGDTGVIEADTSYPLPGKTTGTYNMPLKVKFTITAGTSPGSYQPNTGATLERVVAGGVPDIDISPNDLWVRHWSFYKDSGTSLRYPTGYYADVAINNVIGNGGYFVMGGLQSIPTYRDWGAEFDDFGDSLATELFNAETAWIAEKFGNVDPRRWLWEIENEHTRPWTGATSGKHNLKTLLSDVYYPRLRGLLPNVTIGVKGSVFGSLDGHTGFNNQPIFDWTVPDGKNTFVLTHDYENTIHRDGHQIDFTGSDDATWYAGQLAAAVTRAGAHGGGMAEFNIRTFAPWSNWSVPNGVIFYDLNTRATAMKRMLDAFAAKRMPILGWFRTGDQYMDVTDLYTDIQPGKRIEAFYPEYRPYLSRSTVVAQPTPTPTSPTPTPATPTPATPTPVSPTPTPPAQTGTEYDLAFVKNWLAPLAIGVNLEREAVSFVTPAFCAGLIAAGITHIRMFAQTRASLGFKSSGQMAEFFDATAIAIAAGLKVMLALQDVVYMSDLTDGGCLPFISRCCTEIKARNFPITHFALGHSNEMADYDNATYNARSQEILAAMRAILPTTVLLSSGGYWSSLDTMINPTTPLTIADDRRRLYEWHVYNWDATNISSWADMTTRVEAWAAANKVATICGEFGVYASPPDDSTYPGYPSHLYAAARGMGSQRPLMWTITTQGYWRLNISGSNGTLRPEMITAFQDASAYIKAQSYWNVLTTVSPVPTPPTPTPTPGPTPTPTPTFPTGPYVTVAPGTGNVTVTSQNGVTATVQAVRPITAYTNLLSITGVNGGGGAGPYFGGDKPWFIGQQSGNICVTADLSPAEDGAYSFGFSSGSQSLTINLTVAATASPTPTPTPPTPTPTPSATPRTNLDLAGPGGGSPGRVKIVLKGQSNAYLLTTPSDEPIKTLQRVIVGLTGLASNLVEVDYRRSDDDGAGGPAASSIWSGSYEYAYNATNGPRWQESNPNTSPAAWPNNEAMTEFGIYLSQITAGYPTDRPILLLHMHNEYMSKLWEGEHNQYAAWETDWNSRYRGFLSGRATAKLPIFRAQVCYDSGLQWPMLNAQRASWTANAANSSQNYYFCRGSSLDAENLNGDGSHWTYDASIRAARAMGIRIANWLIENGYANTPTSILPSLPSNGPFISALARVSGDYTKLDVTVTHDGGTDLVVPASPNLGNWYVTNGSGDINVVGINRLNATTLRLSLSAPLDVSGAVTLDYGVRTPFEGLASQITDNWHMLTHPAPISNVAEMSQVRMILSKLRAPLTLGTVVVPPGGGVTTPTPTTTTPTPTPAPTPTPPATGRFLAKPLGTVSVVTTGQYANMTALYAFREGTGTTVANLGTAGGSATLGTGAVMASDATGTHFLGTHVTTSMATTALTATNLGINGTTAKTIFLRFKADAATQAGVNEGCLFGLGNQTNLQGLTIRQFSDTSTSWMADTWFTDAGEFNIGNATDLHTMVFTYAAGSAKIYIDGALVNTKAVTLNIGNTTPLRIGGPFFTEAAPFFFAGKIYELGVIGGTAWTLAQATAYDANPTAMLTPLTPSILSVSRTTGSGSVTAGTTVSFTVLTQALTSIRYVLVGPGPEFVWLTGVTTLATTGSVAVSLPITVNGSFLKVLPPTTSPTVAAVDGPAMTVTAAVPSPTPTPTPVVLPTTTGVSAMVFSEIAPGASLRYSSTGSDSMTFGASGRGSTRWAAVPHVPTKWKTIH